MSSLARDARFGLRGLRKDPAFAAVAVLTLALGISATTAIFSVVHATFLAPLPYREPDRLVMVFTRMDGGRYNVDAGDFVEWKRHADVFTDLEAWTLRSVSLAAGDRPEYVEAGVATPRLLAMMGYGHPLALGRDFLDGEGAVGGEAVAILSHALWQTRFGADPGILGRRIRIDGKPHTVVGVLGAGYADRGEARLWLPLAFTPEELKPDVPDLRHYVVGRLEPGVTVEQADASMAALTARLVESDRRFGRRSASVEPLRNSLLAANTRTALGLLLGAVAFLLLMSCANVASLLLARGTARRRELALRASLGASPASLARQLLTESLLLALAGGALGVALAETLVPAVMALMPVGALPPEADVRLSVPVLLGSLATCGLSALLSGAAPAWRAARVDLNDALKSAAPSLSPGRDGLRRALVASECALALTLLAGGGLAVRGLLALVRVDPGFRTEGLLTFTLPVPEGRLEGGDRIEAFYRELLDRVQDLPGVKRVSVSTRLPVHPFGFMIMSFDVVGEPAPESTRRTARANMVSPGYFETFGIPLSTGRAPTEQDRAGAPRVAVVNEAFVRRFLPSGDPLGRRLAIERLFPGPKLGPAVEWQIVGVSRDVRNADVRSEAVPEITLPFWQSPWPETAMAVRTAGPPASVQPGVAAAVHAMDPDLPMAEVRSMAQVVDDSMAGDRFNTALFGGFAALALLLAAAGVYGVVSSVVAQRTREIGLRMALGAGRAQVLRAVLWDGMTAVLGGAVLGVAGAGLVGRLMRGMVYGIGAVDPAVFLSAALTLVGAAFLACLVPARRAASVDPTVALREE